MIRAADLMFLGLILFAFPLKGDPTASHYNEPYPAAASKKGLQVEWVDDALALGVKHAALNLNISALADLKGDTNNPSWKSEGRTYYFNRAPIESIDQRIKALSDRGVLVNVIVLAYESSDAAVNTLVLHPRYDHNAPNHLGAFNTVTEEGRSWFSACMELLADRWSRPDRKFGRVAGYIIGNEVNSHWFWSNMGPVSMEEFANDYLQTVRLATVAVRKQSSWGRVYVSLEHHWNIHYPGGNEKQTFAGRPFLQYFARRAKEQGDFEWNLAFHPYPENLFEPRFWNDKTATTNTDTPRITFKNIQMLTAFMRGPEMLYAGQARRIILSEQGFHTPKGADGELVQAAAFCYAYKKIEAEPAIDAFILHRHIDNDQEGGLMLGLRGNHPANGEERPKKKIYECFRHADTPEWKSAFEFALPIVGLPDWNQESIPPSPVSGR